MVGLLDDDGLLDLRPPAGREAPPPAPGACHVCGVRPGRTACRACGRPACAADTWTLFGLCKACASERDVARWHHEGRVEERNWLEGPP